MQFEPCPLGLMDGLVMGMQSTEMTVGKSFDAVLFSLNESLLCVSSSENNAARRETDATQKIKKNLVRVTLLIVNNHEMYL